MQPPGPGSCSFFSPPGSIPEAFPSSEAFLQGLRRCRAWARSALCWHRAAPGAQGGHRGDTGGTRRGQGGDTPGTGVTGAEPPQGPLTGGRNTPGMREFGQSHPKDWGHRGHRDRATPGIGDHRGRATLRTGGTGDTGGRATPGRGDTRIYGLGLRGKVHRGLREQHSEGVKGAGTGGKMSPGCAPQESDRVFNIRGVI